MFQEFASAAFTKAADGALQNHSLSRLLFSSVYVYVYNGRGRLRGTYLKTLMKTHSKSAFERGVEILYYLTSISFFFLIN